VRRLLCGTLRSPGNASNREGMPIFGAEYDRKAGVLSQYAYEYLKDGVKDVMPALGTHVAMTDDELTRVSLGVVGMF
jgi:hypothetical protein